MLARREANRSLRAKLGTGVRPLRNMVRRELAGRPRTSEERELAYDKTYRVFETEYTKSPQQEAIVAAPQVCLLDIQIECLQLPRETCCNIRALRRVACWRSAARVIVSNCS
jgi:hypothetical protein